QLIHELVMKRLHGRIIPEHELWRDLAGGTQCIAVGDREKNKGVPRQEIFGRRNGSVNQTCRGKENSDCGKAQILYGHVGWWFGGQREPLEARKSKGRTFISF